MSRDLISRDLAPDDLEAVMYDPFAIDRRRINEELLRRQTTAPRPERVHRPRRFRADRTR